MRFERFARNTLASLSLLAGMALLPLSAQAQQPIIDPEAYILKNGYTFNGVGGDGKTQLYSNTVRVPKGQLQTLSNGIAALPEHADTLKACSFLANMVKTKILQNGGRIDDVRVAQHGYSNAIVACTLNYLPVSSGGSKLIYSKTTQQGVFMVFVSE